MKVLYSSHGLQDMIKRARRVIMVCTTLCSLIVGCSQRSPDIATLKKMIQTGDLAGVSNLITAEPRIVIADLGSHQDDKLQPLMLAVNLKQEAICKFLIAKGAPVNATNNVGWTPLQAAVAVEDAQLVQLLLESGADPTMRDLSGRTPLEWAKASRVPAVIIVALESSESKARNR